MIFPPPFLTPLGLHKLCGACCGTAQPGVQFNCLSGIFFFFFLAIWCWIYPVAVTNLSAFALKRCTWNNFYPWMWSLGFHSTLLYCHCTAPNLQDILATSHGLSAANTSKQVGFPCVQPPPLALEPLTVVHWTQALPDPLHPIFTCLPPQFCVSKWPNPAVAFCICSSSTLLAAWHSTPHVP